MEMQFSLIKHQQMLWRRCSFKSGPKFDQFPWSSQSATTKNKTLTKNLKKRWEKCTRTCSLVVPIRDAISCRSFMESSRNLHRICPSRMLCCGWRRVRYSSRRCLQNRMTSHWTHAYNRKWEMAHALWGTWMLLGWVRQCGWGGRTVRSAAWADVGTSSLWLAAESRCFRPTSLWIQDVKDERKHKKVTSYNSDVLHQLTEERRVSLFNVSAQDARAWRIAQLAAGPEERVDLVSEVEVSASQQSLSAATLANFRLVREHDEIVEAVGHEERETGIVDEKRHSIHLKRLHVLQTQWCLNSMTSASQF